MEELKIKPKGATLTDWHTHKEGINLKLKDKNTENPFMWDNNTIHIKIT